jgi:hypothetical protein
LRGWSMWNDLITVEQYWKVEQENSTSRDFDRQLESPTQALNIWQNVSWFFYRKSRSFPFWIAVMWFLGLPIRSPVLSIVMTRPHSSRHWPSICGSWRRPIPIHSHPFSRLSQNHSHRYMEICPTFSILVSLRRMIITRVGNRLVWATFIRWYQGGNLMIGFACRASERRLMGGHYFRWSRVTKRDDRFYLWMRKTRRWRLLGWEVIFPRC